MDPLARTQRLIRIRGTASVVDAARLMSDLSIGALGVDDDQHRFVGLFTERDLMWVIAQGKEPHVTTIREVMNDYPVIVDGPLTQQEAAAKMLGAHIRHVLVREGDDLRVTSARDLIPEVAGPAAVARVASVSELRRMFGDAVLEHPSVMATGMRPERYV
jgi:CBS domain-containing protein